MSFYIAAITHWRYTEILTILCLSYIIKCHNFVNFVFTAIYKSYLERQEVEVQAFRKDEELILPEDMDYDL